MGTDKSATGVAFSRTLGGNKGVQSIRNTEEADIALKSNDRVMKMRAAKSSLTSNCALIDYLDGEYQLRTFDYQKAALINLQGRTLTAGEAKHAIASDNLDVRKCGLNSPNISNKLLIQYICSSLGGYHTAPEEMRDLSEMAFRKLQGRALTADEAVTALENNWDSGTAVKLQLMAINSPSVPTEALVRFTKGPHLRMSIDAALEVIKHRSK